MIGPRQPELCQGEVGQDTKGHMVMPTAPTANLIVSPYRDICLPSSKHVSMGQRIPPRRTNVSSGVSAGALLSQVFSSPLGTSRRKTSYTSGPGNLSRTATTRIVYLIPQRVGTFPPTNATYCEAGTIEPIGFEVKLRRQPCTSLGQLQLAWPVGLSYTIYRALCNSSAAQAQKPVCRKADGLLGYTAPCQAVAVARPFPDGSCETSRGFSVNLGTSRHLGFVNNAKTTARPKQKLPAGKPARPARRRPSACIRKHGAQNERSKADRQHYCTTVYRVAQVLHSFRWSPIGNRLADL